MHKVLVIGNGGREHALCWKLQQSKAVSKIFCAPGNPGTGTVAENVSIAVNEIEKLAEFAEQHKIDLTIVGPELPLTLGIVDCFRERGLRVFGPTQAAAQLEGSKSFAKSVMVASSVPTAGYAEFTTREAAEEWLGQHPEPVVLKADGLAAGKGVFVCLDASQRSEALQGLFGELQCSKVIAEQFLEGREASLIVATNGRDVLSLAPAHDYKRIGDGDRGPNTGGMGTVSPTPHLTEEQAAWSIQHVIRPVLKEMERRGMPFQGFLYAGLMISSSGKVSVLEFNARLGDPETQSIMRRLDSDLFELLFGLVSGNATAPRWKSEAAVCVVLAAAGYPGAVAKGDEITGIEFAQSMPGAVVFHAGTALAERGRLVTSGGRVLNVTAIGKDIDEARSRVYRAADMIQFRGRQLRRDIAARS